MNKKIIISISATLIILLTFKSTESTCLRLGISWTISKLLPYIFTIIVGVYLFYLIRKITFKSSILKYSLASLTLILPFIIGFAMNPIYEGDFSKLGEDKIINSSPSDFKKNGLTVVTIPDCPFCFGAIEKLKTLKQRNPSLKIDFVVCSSKAEFLKTYKEEINGAFNVRTADNPDSLAKTSGFRFPAFFYVSELKPKNKWSNDQFGVRAMDDLESMLK